MLFGYRQVAEAFRNPSLSSSMRLDDMRREFATVLSEAQTERAVRIFARQLESRDPPEHTRVRQAFGACFHRVVSEIRPAICATIEDLNRVHGWRFPLDLVSALARPLPLQIVLEALGIDCSARPRFGEDVAMFLRHLSDATVDGERAFERLRIEVKTATQGILALLSQRDDLIEEDDVVANAILIISAGHRTTTNLIGSLLFTLINNRPELERLAECPALIPGAVEETLRMESPIQAIQRTARTSAKVGGVEMMMGDSVTLVVGSANRDSEEFPDPEQFNPARSPNRHLAFGFGNHFCLGSALARMQATVVLEYLVPRLMDLRIISAVWHEDTNSRGLAQLIVDKG